MDLERWNRILGVHLTGTYALIKACLPDLRGGGAVVNVASVAALVGTVGQSNYCAAKAGILGLTRALARELGPLGLRINAVAPGFIETEMLRGLPAKQLDEIRRQIPARRLGRPDEVAQLIVYLLSESASYIQGQTIVIDGGLW
jgi:3-oxoacyl-[acyl-carrier protein] reductase